MSTEDRLREALHGRAATVEPRADGWTRIEQKMNATSSARNLRVSGLVAAAAAVVVAVALIAVAQKPDDVQHVQPGPGPSTTTSTTEVAVVPTGPAFIWPFDHLKTTYDTPEALAGAFARDFLNMADPTISDYRSGDNNSGEIDVHPYSTGTIGSTLLVRRDSAGHWNVLTAMSDDLQLDTPTTGDHIPSPVTLKGRSRAFEGQVQVTLLRFGTSMLCAFPTDSCGSDPGVLANTYFTGHGTEMGPFETTVSWTDSSHPYALLVLWTASARDGTLAEATVRLVRVF